MKVVVEKQLHVGTIPAPMWDMKAVGSDIESSLEDVLQMMQRVVESLSEHPIVDMVKAVDKTDRYLVGTIAFLDMFGDFTKLYWYLA